MRSSCGCLPSEKSGMRLCCGFIAARRWSAVWPGAFASAIKVGSPLAGAVAGERSTTWQLAHQRLASSAPRSGLWASAADEMPAVQAMASASLAGAVLRIKLLLSRGYGFGLGQPVDGLGEQPVLHRDHRELARPVDEVAPRVVELAQAAHDRHYAADLDAPLERHPAADAERHRDREVVHQVHQQVHRVLEAVDPHVERED